MHQDPALALGLKWFSLSQTSLVLEPTFSMCVSLSRECMFYLLQMSRECMFLGSLSRHNKDLERRTLKPLARHSSRVLDKPCYSSQTNQCYSSILFRRQQENPRLEEKRVEECVGREGGGERERERERARTCEIESERKRFGSSFYMFFPPPGPALCKLGLARSAVCSA